MEVTAQYLGDPKFEVADRGHRVVCDQPRDNGGSDEGMPPPELLLGSLATCAAYYAAQYLKTRGLPAEELRVRVSAETVLHPTRLASFRNEVTAPALDEPSSNWPTEGRESLSDSQHTFGTAKYRSRGQCRGISRGVVSVVRTDTIRSGTDLWNGKPKLNSRGS
jgi:hypothetical protein